MYEVIVIGGGPAGLSAALILGRCRRRVLVCDSGRPRNASARQLHGFLTRDGVPPLELRRLAREELAAYENVEYRSAEALEVTCREGGFDVLFDDGVWHSTRMLLLATGVVDDLPPLDGVEDLYGQSVFHCPYCDGWEVRDQPLAMYKPAADTVDSTLELTVWSRDVALCTDGPAELSEESRRRLERHSIVVYEQPIARLDGTGGQLKRIIFADGSVLPRRAMFFSTAFRQHSKFPEALGCNFIDQPVVDTGRKQTTNVPGLFVAGDAGRESQLAVVAAAEGAKAAFAINTALAEADTA